MKKIVLIHGWDDKIFYHIKEKPTEREYFGNEFIDKLSEKFEVIFLNLPGFFNTPESKKELWKLDDYSNYLKDFLELHKDIEYIIARSFGGAVAIKAKESFNLEHKLILFAPAIIRGESNKNIQVNSFVKTIVPNIIREYLRDLYLIYYVKNSFYKNATKCLRKTYRNIVTINLIENFKNIKAKDVLVFFGKNDTATPPNLLIEKLLDEELKKQIKVLNNGGHNFFTEDNPSEKIKYCLDEIEIFLQ